MRHYPYNIIYRLKGLTQPKSTTFYQAACKNWDYKKFLYSKNGAAVGFQNLTAWKFRKTQRNMTSELEEPLLTAGSKGTSSNNGQRKPKAEQKRVGV